jgi:tape measure domain-containing protein
MSVDIATLGLRVDSSQLHDANGELRILIEVGTKAEKATDGVKDSFSGLKTVLAGLGLGAVIREGIQLADTYSNIEGRLSLVTTGTGQLADVTEKLYASAQRSRVGFEATADLYSSLARSTKSLGTSQGDLLQVTETINKALIVSGASAATAEGALTQLGQGFASGTLRGDELNSVLEGTPRLAQAIADGMGVTVGQLRALGAEGKITGETVFNALKSQKDAVEAEFAKMPTTVSQSFVQLQNAVLKYVGQANSAGGVTATMAAGIGLLAKNLDTVVPLVVTIAAALGIGYVTSAVAARIASIEMASGLTAVGLAAKNAGASLLGMFGGPVGLAITAVTLGITSFAMASMEAGRITETVNATYADLEKKLAAAAESANKSAGGQRSMGIDSANAAPGVDSLTGSVKLLADMYYRTADAAKKARIEMAATTLAKAREEEAAAVGQTQAGRNASYASMRPGDLTGNVSTLWNAAVGNARNFFSGGRTDREAEAVAQKAVQNSRNAKKLLDDAYTDFTTKGSSAVQANDAEIKKLTSQIGDLRKLRDTATAEERKQIDKRLTKDNRQLELLKTGADPDAIKVATGGSGGSGKKPAKTDAQRDYDSAVKSSEKFIESLNNESDAIGKNDIETKMLAAEREAAKAPTEALRQSILASAGAWASETLLTRAGEGARKAATEAGERETKARDEALKTGAAMADQIAFETSLVGMNAQQRAVAIAVRDLETKGIKQGSIAWDIYGKAVADAASVKGGLDLQSEQATGFANRMQDIADRTKGATQAFGELFGTAGQGFATLIEAVSDYAEQSAAADARIAEARARYGADSAEAIAAESDAREQAKTRELNSYGAILGGIKGMFKEKSAGYKVMEAAEKAYAVVRTALALKDLVLEGLLTTTKVAGAGTRMATDAAETGSSVANSGIRAAADGVAAFAKTVASLPFPLNLVAGAAVLAALAGVGVMIAGSGGGGSSASASAEPANDNGYSSFTKLSSNYNNTCQLRLTSAARPLFPQMVAITLSSLSRMHLPELTLRKRGAPMTSCGL